MSTEITLSNVKLPSFLKGKTAAANPFAAAVSAGGFPVISIKGKVFHVQRGDERTLVTKPGADDEPASSLEVVIVSVNPNRSKVFYSSGYEEGAADKPTCYSNNGIQPEADAEDPQAKKCAVCPHAQWGSRVTESGKKAKACSDSMRLAVAPAGQINDPMLIRVPATSLNPLGQYGAALAKRGLSPEHVVTKIGFDYSVSHPSLTFKFIRLITEDEYADIQNVLQEESETIGQITGIIATDAANNVEHMAEEGETPEPVEEEEAPAPKPKAKAKPAPKKEPEPEPEDDDEDEEIDDIDDALDNFDFDD